MSKRCSNPSTERSSKSVGVVFLSNGYAINFAIDVLVNNAGTLNEYGVKLADSNVDKFIADFVSQFDVEEPSSHSLFRAPMPSDRTCWLVDF